MKDKRKVHGGIIESFQKEQEQNELNCKIIASTNVGSMPESTDNDITDAFNKVVSSKKRENTDSLYKTKTKIKRKRVHKKDTENFIPYASADKHTEEGLAINSFERQAQNAEFSVNDRVQEVVHKPGLKKWDRIKKKMVAVQDPRAGKIRTESGIWIPKTYKTGRYDEWKEKNKIEEQVKREVGDDYTGMSGITFDTVRNRIVHKSQFIFCRSWRRISNHTMGTQFGQTRA